MGDACEMLVAAELTLAGIPAMKMPDNWPGYDVIAQPAGRLPQRVSVKSRTFKKGRDAYVEYNANDTSFDWLAIVVLPGEEQEKRRIFVVPKDFADSHFYHYPAGAKFENFRSVQIDRLDLVLKDFENNFILNTAETSKSQ